jgi:hypothetical protein
VLGGFQDALARRSFVRRNRLGGPDGARFGRPRASRTRARFHARAFGGSLLGSCFAHA